MGFSAGLWLPLLYPRARRFEDDLLEVVAADDDDREIEPAAFAHQSAADGLAGGRLLGDTDRIRQTLPDGAERRQIVAILQVKLGEGQGGFAANELAGCGADGVSPDPIIVQGFHPVDRDARAAVEADIRGRGAGMTGLGNRYSLADRDRRAAEALDLAADGLAFSRGITICLAGKGGGCAARRDGRAYRRCDE